MEVANLPTEIWLLLSAVVLGLSVGYAHACRGSPKNPIWPIKFYLRILEQHVLTFRRYASNRTVFRFREQFLAASFIWFLVFFLSMLIGYEAS